MKLSLYNTGGRRSVSYDDLFYEASLGDSDDCLKSFVCQASARKGTEFEKAVAKMFSGDIDYDSGSVEFMLAARVGMSSSNGKEDKCKRIYARCPAGYEEIRAAVKGMVEEAQGSIEENDVE